MCEQPTSFLLWKHLQRENVYHCHTLDGTGEYRPVRELGSSNKPYKIWPDSAEPDTYYVKMNYVPLNKKFY